MKRAAEGAESAAAGDAREPVTAESHPLNETMTHSKCLDSLPTQEEIGELVRLLAQPIDADALAASGLLAKAGAWWAVPDMKQLPAHVAAKIVEMKRTADGRMFIRLRKPRTVR